LLLATSGDNAEDAHAGDATKSVPALPLVHSAQVWFSGSFPVMEPELYCLQSGFAATVRRTAIITRSVCHVAKSFANDLVGIVDSRSHGFAGDGAGGPTGQRCARR